MERIGAPADSALSSHCTYLAPSHCACTPTAVMNIQAILQSMFKVTQMPSHACCSQPRMSSQWQAAHQKLIQLPLVCSSHSYLLLFCLLICLCQELDEPVIEYLAGVIADEPLKSSQHLLHNLGELLLSYDVATDEAHAAKLCDQIYEAVTGKKAATTISNSKSTTTTAQSNNKQLTTTNNNNTTKANGSTSKSTVSSSSTSSSAAADPLAAPAGYVWKVVTERVNKQ